MENETKQKKSLKWLWIVIALVVVAGIIAWCTIYASTPDENGKEPGLSKVYSWSSLLLGIFIITVLGYLLGRVTIKGVSLGTAGVFLVAILFGVLFSLDAIKDIPLIKGFFMEEIPLFPAGHPNAGKIDYSSLSAASTSTLFYKNVISNIGLVMFVVSVGLIAGPNFFRDLKKNFKTYILMGTIIILAGSAVAVLCVVISPFGADFWSGVLSGALTSTPGYSAAIEAMGGGSTTLITIGHAIAYPFGVIGVVLFVQLMPKFLKANMEKERQLLKINAPLNHKSVEGLFECDPLGLTPLALSVVIGLLVGALKIPLPGGANFSLGTTGGVLISGLIIGHFGRIGKMSLKVPEHTTKVLKELGLMLFLIGAGVEGGVSLVGAISKNPEIIAWGFLGGAVMTLIPMVVGYFLGKKLMKLPLLNSLGSITGGMTSTPALGTLINTAKTEDVASAYASTYPIALVLIVLACNLMVGLMM